MTADTLDLASLLCSRLCHDMLSPVGAMTNGLELLADENDPAMRERCMDLLAESARVSAAKLKFFRLAFGAAGSAGDRIALTEAHDLVEGLAAGARRIELAWAVPAPSLPKAAVKTLLNFAQMAIEALPRGGRIDLAAEELSAADGATVCEIVVRASGLKIAFDPAIGAALEGSAEAGALTSRNAPAVMLRQLAEDCGGQLQYLLDEDALVLGAALPSA